MAGFHLQSRISGYFQRREVLIVVVKPGSPGDHGGIVNAIFQFGDEIPPAQRFTGFDELSSQFTVCTYSPCDGYILYPGVFTGFHQFFYQNIHYCLLNTRSQIRFILQYEVLVIFHFPLEEIKKSRLESAKTKVEICDGGMGECENRFSCGSQTINMRPRRIDRKSTRLNSSHVKISYAVFCLKKKK